MVISVPEIRKRIGAFLSLIVKNCVFSSPSVVCNCQIIFPVQIHLGFVHFERNFPNGWFHGLFLMKKLFYFFRKIKKKQQPCNAIYCRYWFLDLIQWDQNIFEVAVLNIFFYKKVEWSLMFLNRNSILLPKLFWPTVRKNCSRDWEKTFEIQGWRPRKFKIH